MSPSPHDTDSITIDLYSSQVPDERFLVAKYSLQHSRSINMILQQLMSCKTIAVVAAVGIALTAASPVHAQKSADTSGIDYQIMVQRATHSWVTSRVSAWGLPAFPLAC